MPANTLAALGWNSSYEVHLRVGLEAMRVVIEHQDRYTIEGEDKRLDAHLTGTMLRTANLGEGRPAVGDWVGLNEDGLIAQLLPRQTAFSRLSPKGHIQVISANIDRVFVVSSCNLEFNLRRLERYLGAIHSSGAKSAIVLTKIDLADSVSTFQKALQGIGDKVPVAFVNAKSGEGVEALFPLLGFGKSVALVGSSGVGKSTLANRLLGAESLPTAPIRENDAKGRHTTTRRELVVLPEERGVLIDTPGMRELQLPSEDQYLSEAFDDIEELARTCRFSNCGHKSEPGCKVRGVVAKGRLLSFQKLQLEQGRRKQWQPTKRKKGLP